MQGAGQEVPGAQHSGQEPCAAFLHHVDHDGEDNQHHHRHANAHQCLPAGQRQAKHCQGQDQEAQEEVERGEPAVFGRAVAQGPGQPDGQPGEGYGVPQQDAHDVEEEMTQCDLEGGGIQRGALRFTTTLELLHNDNNMDWMVLLVGLLGLSI